MKTLALLLALPLAGLAQNLPDAPQPRYARHLQHKAASHIPKAPAPKFFSPLNITELTLVAGSLAADAMSTEKLQEFNNSSVGCGIPGPCHFTRGDANPLVRLFARNRIGNGLYFGAALAGDVLLTYELRKHRHPRIAHIVNWSIIAGESYLAQSNYRFVNNSQIECILHHPVAIQGMPTCNK